MLATIPEELKEKEPVTELKFPGDCLKALGVHWDTDQDTLHVSTPNIQLCGELTKHKLVSDVAKTYDVLGWFAPAVFFAKCLLQRTWEARISWDDPVPKEILIDWQRWAEELPMLTRRLLQRCYMESSKEADAKQIHGFSDASEKGYSAVVYIRILYSDSTVSISLMAAKTKVAPIKRETILRLELSGALLLAKLLDSVKTTLNFSLSKIYAWSDSKIVLAWLDGSPHRLQAYVANHVSQIMELLPSSVWHHVPTATNPADCASRGMLPQDLLHHSLWWDGPPWLLLEPTAWPVSPKEVASESHSEACAFVTTTLSFNFLEKFSTLRKLRRVLACVYRFINNSHKKLSNNINSTLSVDELILSLHVLIALSQNEYFSAELFDLQKGKDVSVNSSLSMLRPYLDSEGVNRVGGRLRKSHLRHAQRHPVILHHKSRLSHLLLRDAHLQFLHTGPQQMISSISLQYHILSCRHLARPIFRSCVSCRRQQAKTYPQVMGQLPSSRMTPGHPFAHTGVDYADSIILKVGKVRKPVHIKSYIWFLLVFQCEQFIWN